MIKKITLVSILLLCISSLQAQLPQGERLSESDTFNTVEQDINHLIAPLNKSGITLIY